MLKNLIIGHLGKDAVVSNVNGNTVINFNVAHSESWTDNNGVKNQKSIWVGCSYWTEKTGIAQYLKSGTQVYIEGNADCKTYQNAKGGVQAQLTCKVITIQLIGGNKETQSTPLPAPNHYSAVEMKSDISTESENLPF